MPLVPCRECKQSISSEAQLCPKCGIGSPAPDEPSNWPVIAVLAALIAGGAYHFFYSEDAKSSALEKSMTTAELREFQSEANAWGLSLEKTVAIKEASNAVCKSCEELAKGRSKYGAKFNGYLNEGHCYVKPSRNEGEVVGKYIIAVSDNLLFGNSVGDWVPVRAICSYDVSTGETAIIQIVSN